MSHMSVARPGFRQRFWMLTLAVTALLVWGLSTAALAQSVTVQQTKDPTVAIEISEILGQVIQVPPGKTRLERFMFGVGDHYIPVVHAYDYETKTIGSVLYEGRSSVAMGAGNSELVLPDGGLVVTPGTYILIGAAKHMFFSGYLTGSSDNPFADGFVAQRKAGVDIIVTDHDLYFSATFVTPPTPVPTLTEWAMILFGGLLASVAVLLIQQRRLIA